MNRYTVWVGGGEVNDYELTLEEALKVAEQYIADGYEDVVIQDLSLKEKV